MIAILDVSAAIEIVLQRPLAEKFAAHVADADWVIAPSLFISEATNVFWKYQKLADLVWIRRLNCPIILLMNVNFTVKHLSWPVL